MTATAEPGARIVISRDFTVGTIDRRLFGSFVEHMGRCVYTGIYEPGHPRADDEGFRTDVEELVDELGPTLVRYPGGNFVSGYQWEDGIGPREARPRRIDYAWRSIETNQIGVDEFLPWMERRGLETMMAVNLGTRGISEAANLVEYCNLESGTYWSDLRRANGREKSYGVGLWCLGNEMDGPWQIGHKTAIEYGRLAAQTAQAMKAVDPSIELVACGSSSRDMSTFGEWEATVLGECWDYVDYISLHAYYEERDHDRRTFLESGAALDGFIRDVVATVDSVAASRHSTKRVGLSLDEWNVWYTSNLEQGDYGVREAPRLIEDDYSALDAVVVGDLLIAMINNADRLKIGCQAQLVNVIAPIRTEPGGDAWRMTTFYPFAAAAKQAGSTVLDARVESTSQTPDGRLAIDDVAFACAVKKLDDGSEELTFFLTNRAAASARVVVETQGYPGLEVKGASVMTADLSGGRPSAREAEDAAPRGFGEYTSTESGLELVLEPESWTVCTARAHPVP
ncbi:MAG TPA: alpha-L-arabinofuranosidase C-terminal domain-containing protein [Galbitalea sp.]|jgi:alpha-N-arabinofuranosidase|nr:alpha-L-arabinofuranosidase C-terminal domain-containing protein [Galbitalea sp.]